METNQMENAKLRKLIVSVVFGAVGGFVVSYALMRSIQIGVFGELDRSRTLAAFAGSMYLLCAAFVGLGLLSPKVGAKFLNVEDADELQEQALMLRYSVFGIAAFAVCLLLLAFAAPIGPVPQTAVAASVIALMVAATLTSMRQLKAMDELNAKLGTETASMSFYLMASLGGGWSVFAHLGFVPALAPLDWLTLMAAVMLVAAFWVSGRRGLLTPR